MCIKETRALYSTQQSAEFHLATKIWGGSAINEWVHLACQVPWDVFLGEFVKFLRIVLCNFWSKTNMLVVWFGDLLWYYDD